MGEVFETHKVVSLDGSFDVGTMDTECYSHEHLLRSLDDLTVHLEQVSPLNETRRPS